MRRAGQLWLARDDVAPRLVERAAEAHPRTVGGRNSVRAEILGLFWASQVERHNERPELHSAETGLLEVREEVRLRAHNKSKTRWVLHRPLEHIQDLLVRVYPLKEEQRAAPHRHTSQAGDRAAELVVVEATEDGAYYDNV